jgi:hypothetical protein
MVISIAQAVSAAIAGAGYARFGYPPVLIGIAVATVVAAAVFRILCAPQGTVEQNQ